MAYIFKDSSLRKLVLRHKIVDDCVDHLGSEREYDEDSNLLGYRINDLLTLYKCPPLGFTDWKIHALVGLDELDYLTRAKSLTLQIAKVSGSRGRLQVELFGARNDDPFFAGCEGLHDVTQLKAMGFACNVGPSYAWTWWTSPKIYHNAV